MKKKLQLFVILALVCTLLSAQSPIDYYNPAFGKSNIALRLALQDIIDGHTNVGYDGLWKVYRVSDIRDDGKVWDMYSTCNWTPGNSQCGNYKTVCDCYNREHSVPQSWFGKRSPMVSDAFHIYPTDGKVNGQRNDHPFGECENGVKCDNNSNSLGRLGNSTFSGYTNVGTVFEPEDEYKGDFARTYFYMATRYADQDFTSGSGNKVFTHSNSGNPKCNLTSYSVALFIKWHRQDPVSPKEIDRNNAIYEFQKNRNPFVDFPQLAEYIWGDSIAYVFDPTAPPNQLEEIKVVPPTIYVADATLYVNASSEGFVTQLYNVYGQLIAQEQSTSTTYNILLEQDRLYIVRITDHKGNSWTYKILSNNK